MEEAQEDEGEAAAIVEDEDDDWAEKDSIHVVSSEELSDIIEHQDIIFNF